MTLLAAPQLRELIADNIINADPQFVNAASIDICLGDSVLVEDKTIPAPFCTAIDIAAKQSPNFIKIDIPDDGLVIQPGECFLAHSVETFNLPDNISAQFVLRSSVARCFLEHMQAGWCDAGWHGAQLTMEFKNMNQMHPLRIRKGMRIGQMVFFSHDAVGDDSYAVKGNYNGQQGATQAFTGQFSKAIMERNA